MKTITLNSGSPSGDKLVATQLADQMIRAGVPFHHYVTTGGYHRFRFTFDSDFELAKRFMTSRKHRDTWTEGKEEP